MLPPPPSREKKVSCAAMSAAVRSPGGDAPKRTPKFGADGSSPAQLLTLSQSSRDPPPPDVRHAPVGASVVPSLRPPHVSLPSLRLPWVVSLARPPPRPSENIAAKPSIVFVADVSRYGRSTSLCRSRRCRCRLIPLSLFVIVR